MNISELGKNIIGKKCKIENNNLPDDLKEKYKNFLNQELIIFDYDKNFYNNNTINIYNPNTHEYIWVHHKYLKLI